MLPGPSCHVARNRELYRTWVTSVKRCPAAASKKVYTKWFPLKRFGHLRVVCRPMFRFGRLFQNDFCRLMLPAWDLAVITTGHELRAWDVGLGSSEASPARIAVAEWLHVRMCVLLAC